MSREVEISGLVYIKYLSLGIKLGWTGGWLWSIQNLMAIQSITSYGEMGMTDKDRAAEIGLQQDCAGRATN